MTNELIKKVSDLIVLDGKFSTDEFNKTINALEKQIQKGILAGELDSRGYADTFICPSCGAYIHMPYLQRECDYNYCPYCGQRLE